MRRGIFGGTFDPIHYGHLLLAETARDFGSLDEVLFVPAGIPPHKINHHTASKEDRFQMLSRAICDVPEFAIERFEIDSPGISYTIKTVEYLEKKYPGDSLFLIVGSETLADLPHWYCTEKLCSKITLLTAWRGGTQRPDFSVLKPFVADHVLQEWERYVLPMPVWEISSTAIRHNIATGRSIRFQTPPAVEEYIKEHHLYQTGQRTS